MKAKFCTANLILALLLVTVPVAGAYSQDTGTFPQSETSSRNQPQAQPSQVPPPDAGETQIAAPGAGVGNHASLEARRGAAWRWLALGLAIGLLVGALAWRRAAAMSNIRRDRVA
jgi:hypothetical protein